MIFLCYRVFTLAKIIHGRTCSSIAIKCVSIRARAGVARCTVIAQLFTVVHPKSTLINTSCNDRQQHSLLFTIWSRYISIQQKLSICFNTTMKKIKPLHNYPFSNSTTNNRTKAYIFLYNKSNNKYGTSI